MSTDGSGSETQPLSAILPEPPTPSPDWPRDLTTLVKLRPEQARALAKDYDLDDGSIGQSSKTVSEEFVNRFLSLAGVRFYFAYDELPTLTTLTGRSSI